MGKYSIEVLNALDGDTLRVNEDEKERKKFTDQNDIRVEGIDSFETDKPGKITGNPLSKYSTEVLEALGRDKATIETEGEYDPYGRQLGTIRDKEGEEVTDELIQAGLGNPTGFGGETEVADQNQSMLTGISRSALGMDRTTDPRFQDVSQRAQAQRDKHTWKPFSDNPDLEMSLQPYDTRGDFARSWDRGSADVKASVGGAINWLGDALGSEDLVEKGKAMTRVGQVESKGSARTIKDFTKANSLSDKFTYIVETAGEMAPGLIFDVLATVATGGAGAGQALARRAGIEAVKQGTKKGIIAGPALSGFMQSVGNMENTLEAKGSEENTGAGLASGVTGALANSVPFLAVFNRLAKSSGLKDEAITSMASRLKDIGKTGMVGSGTEGLASTAQMLVDKTIEKVALDEDEWDIDSTQMIDDTIRAVLGGGMAGSSASSVTNTVGFVREYNQAQRAAFGEGYEADTTEREADTGNVSSEAIGKIDGVIAGFKDMSDDKDYVETDSVPNLKPARYKTLKTQFEPGGKKISSEQMTRLVEDGEATWDEVAQYTADSFYGRKNKVVKNKNKFENEYLREAFIRTVDAVQAGDIKASAEAKDALLEANELGNKWDVIAALDLVHPAIARTAKAQTVESYNGKAMWKRANGETKTKAQRKAEAAKEERMGKSPGKTEVTPEPEVEAELTAEQVAARAETAKNVADREAKAVTLAEDKVTGREPTAEESASAGDKEVAKIDFKAVLAELPGLEKDVDELAANKPTTIRGKRDQRFAIKAKGDMADLSSVKTYGELKKYITSYGIRDFSSSGSLKTDTYRVKRAIAKEATQSNTVSLDAGKRESLNELTGQADTLSTDKLGEREADNEYNSDKPRKKLSLKGKGRVKVTRTGDKTVSKPANKDANPNAKDSRNAKDIKVLKVAAENGDKVAGDMLKVLGDTKSNPALRRKALAALPDYADSVRKDTRHADAILEDTGVEFTEIQTETGEERSVGDVQQIESDRSQEEITIGYYARTDQDSDLMQQINQLGNSAMNGNNYGRLKSALTSIHKRLMKPQGDEVLAQNRDNMQITQHPVFLGKDADAERHQATGKGAGQKRKRVEEFTTQEMHQLIDLVEAKDTEGAIRYLQDRQLVGERALMGDTPKITLSQKASMLETKKLSDTLTEGGNRKEELNKTHIEVTNPRGEKVFMNAYRLTRLGMKENESDSTREVDMTDEMHGQKERKRTIDKLEGFHSGIVALLEMGYEVDLSGYKNYGDVGYRKKGREVQEVRIAPGVTLGKATGNARGRRSLLDEIYREEGAANRDKEREENGSLMEGAEKDVMDADRVDNSKYGGGHKATTVRYKLNADGSRIWQPGKLEKIDGQLDFSKGHYVRESEVSDQTAMTEDGDLDDRADNFAGDYGRGSKQEKGVERDYVASRERELTAREKLNRRDENSRLTAKKAKEPEDERNEIPAKTQEEAKQEKATRKSTKAKNKQARKQAVKDREVGQYTMGPKPDVNDGPTPFDGASVGKDFDEANPVPQNQGTRESENKAANDGPSQKESDNKGTRQTAIDNSNSRSDAVLESINNAGLDKDKRDLIIAEMEAERLLMEAKPPKQQAKGRRIQTERKFRRAVKRNRKQAKKSLFRLVEMVHTRLERIHPVFNGLSRKFLEDSRIGAEYLVAEMANTLGNADSIQKGYEDVRKGVASKEAEEYTNFLAKADAVVSEHDPMHKPMTGVKFHLDLTKIDANRAGFLQILREHKVKDPEQLIEGIFEGNGMPEWANFAGGTKGMGGRLEAMRPALEALDAAGMLDNDAPRHLVQHAFAAGRWSAWNKHFGGKKEGKYSANAQFDKLAAEVHPGNKTEFIRLVEGITGKMGMDAKPWVRKFNSTAMAFQTATVLWFTAVASVPELAAVYSRSRGMTDTLTKDFLKLGQGRSRAEMLRVAKDYNIVVSEVVEHALQQLYSLDGVTTGRMSQKIANTVFKYNGQQWLTETSRALATSVGRRFLEEHARNNDARSKRMLKEVGVTAEQVFSHLDSGDMNTVEGKAYRDALHRFVNQSVTNPSAGQVPLIGSDPRFMILTSLKKFFYGFYDNVHKGLYRNYKDSGNDKAEILPMIATGALLVPLAGMAELLREIIKYPMGRSAGYERNASDWVQTIFGATGGMGPLQSAQNASEMSQYGKNPGVVFAGPTVSYLNDAMQGNVGLSRNLPLAAQLPWMGKYIDGKYKEAKDAVFDD
jgi:hypothetical protein